MRNLPHNAANLANPLRSLAAVAATAVAFGLALMFSVVLVAVILVAGMLGWGYLWWKTRELRKQMRAYPTPGVATEREMAGEDATRGEIIEGEAIRVVEIRDEK
ncbi:MAG: hypothetical protein WBM09_05355 [Gallionella sp.]